MNNKLLCLCAMTVISATAVRAGFDPTRHAKPVTLLNFASMPKSDQRRDLIVFLELGPTDFWGRDVVLVNNKKMTNPGFVVASPEFYSWAFHHLPLHGVHCRNIYLNATPPLQLVLSVILFGAYAILLWFFPRRHNEETNVEC